MKKALSLLLALVMAVGLVVPVWAENEGGDGVEAGAAASNGTDSLNIMGPLEDSNAISAKEFLESIHSFTYGDKTGYYAFNWNGPSPTQGEYHVCATDDVNTPIQNWTDCGAIAAPNFQHYAKDSLQYATAVALRHDWGKLNNTASEDVCRDTEIWWLIEMIALETEEYGEQDMAAAKEFLDTANLGFDDGSATIVLQGSFDSFLDTYWSLDGSVCAALQRAGAREVTFDNGKFTYNFMQLLFRTLSKQQAGGGGLGFDEETEELHKAGFKAPEDVEFVFPEGLERGKDYEYSYDAGAGDLRITLLKYNDGENWVTAADKLTADRKGLDMRIIVYAKDEEVRVSTLNGNGGFESLMKLDKVTSSGEIYNERNSKRATSGGANIASINRTGGQVTIIPTADMNHHRFAVVWGKEDGTITRRELVNVYIELQETFTVTAKALTLTPIPVERIKAGYTQKVGDTEWSAEFENGKIVLTALKGIRYSGDETTLGQLDWTKMAPDGYELESWRRGDAGSSSGPVANIWDWPNKSQSGFSQLFEVTWKNKNDSSDRMRQTLEVLQTDGKPSYAKVGEGSITGKAPETMGIDTAKLSKAGITVTYDQKLGYFHTSFADGVLPDYDTLVNTMITLEAPEGTVYFTRNNEDGNRDPRAGGAEDVERTMRLLRESKDRFYLNGGYEEVRARSLPIMLPQELSLDGIDICVSRTNNYRAVVVAWWGENNKLLGISYVYGQNDDLVLRTTSKSVQKLEDIAKNETKPMVVGAENMELICDRYPQTENSNSTQYFEFTLLNDQLKEKDKTICIPYSYFGLDYERDIKGKTDLPNIVVHHYDERHNQYEGEKGEFFGTYEPQGIVFKTKTFSPFTVSLVEEGGGQEEPVKPSPSHYYYYTTSATTAKDSPTTFDPGVALYLGLTLTSATGLAWLGRKKH